MQSKKKAKNFCFLALCKDLFVMLSYVNSIISHKIIPLAKQAKAVSRLPEVSDINADFIMLKTKQPWRKINCTENLLQSKESSFCTCDGKLYLERKTFYCLHAI